MSTTFHYIGIDVSKDHLDIAQQQSHSQAKPTKAKIHNQEKSIRKWLAKLDPATALLVLEPTGTYHDRLILLAHEYQIAFALVPTKISHHHAKSEGHLHLNDGQAAASLLSYGWKATPQPSKMPSEKQQQRKQLITSLKALKKQQNMLSNQVHALEQLYRTNEVAIGALQSTLEVVDGQINRLEKELHELEDEEEKALCQLMQTVVGIGPKSARELLCYFGDFSAFEAIGQVLNFAGVVPTSHTSGTSVWKQGNISKQGPKSLRAVLYLAARSARRFNLACKDLYERLRSRGKNHKQAMVAVVAKLIKQVFAVVKSKTPFDNQYYLNFDKIFSDKLGF